MAKKHIRRIIFTLTPLKGHYRYKDVFQIYPIDFDAAPKAENAKHFPSVLEYEYEDSEVQKIKPFDSESLNEMMSHTMADTNKLIRITNLLSSVTNYRFFFYRDTENNWAIPLPVIPDEMSAEEKQKIDMTKSFWSWKLYYYPNMYKDLADKSWAIPKSNHVLLVPNDLYYYYDPVEGNKKSITLPLKIDELLDKYFNLSEKELKVVDSAIYQLCNGLDLFSNMKSLSFFSFVSSIETLVNYEFKDEKIELKCKQCKSIANSDRHCEACGEPIWGVSAKFKEFLFKYVSKEEGANTFYNKIYSIRSKIAHTEYLISEENFMSWNFNDKTEEVGIKHLEAKQLSRRSLVNWLLLRKTTTV